MYPRGGLSGHTSPPAMEKEVQSNHRISAWFALKGTFKVIQCHPLQWQGHLPPEQVVPSPIQLIPKSAKIFFILCFFHSLFFTTTHPWSSTDHRLMQTPLHHPLWKTLKNSQNLQWQGGWDFSSKTWGFCVPGPSPRDRGLVPVPSFGPWGFCLTFISGWEVECIPSVLLIILQ